VTSTATCSNMSPTCMTTSSSSGLSFQHSATIPRLYVSKGHRHSDDVINQLSQGQGQIKADDTAVATPGVDFLFTDCRPLQVRTPADAFVNIHPQNSKATGNGSRSRPHLYFDLSRCVNVGVSKDKTILSINKINHL
jgi:hypothetical protein